MTAYTAPTFQERAALAQKARQKALDQLRAKPPIDEAALEQRRLARLKREAAAAEKSRAKRESEKQAKVEKQAALAEASVAAKKTAEASELTEQEKKAARDARYAARKNRK